MPFPSSPINGQQAVVNAILYSYNSTKGAWVRISNASSTITVDKLVLTNSGSDSLSSIGGITTSGNLNITGRATLGTGTTSNVVVAATTTSTSTTTGALVVRGGLGVAGDIFATGNTILGTGTTSNVVVAATTTSTSTTTGALVVRGGIGAAGNIVLTGDVQTTAAGFGSVGARFTANTAVKGDIHITPPGNGANATSTLQYGITFSPSGNVSNTQGAILIAENGSDGTAIGMFTTNNYAAGPQLRWSVSPAGFVNTPAQPFFIGRPTNDYSGGGMPTLSPMPITAIINNGSHFNASTNRFTAPIAGYYKATWGGLQLAATVTSLMVNGVRVHNGNHFPSAVSYISMTQTAIVQLAASDYLTIEQWNGGGFYRDWYLWSVELIG